MSDIKTKSVAEQAKEQVNENKKVIANAAVTPEQVNVKIEKQIKTNPFEGSDVSYVIKPESLTLKNSTKITYTVEKQKNGEIIVTCTKNGKIVCEKHCIENSKGEILEIQNIYYGKEGKQIDPDTKKIIKDSIAYKEQYDYLDFDEIKYQERYYVEIYSHDDKNIGTRFYQDGKYNTVASAEIQNSNGKLSLKTELVEDTVNIDVGEYLHNHVSNIEIMDFGGSPELSYLYSRYFTEKTKETGIGCVYFNGFINDFDNDVGKYGKLNKDKLIEYAKKNLEKQGIAKDEIDKIIKKGCIVPFSYNGHISTFFIKGNDVISVDTSNYHANDDVDGLLNKNGEITKFFNNFNGIQSTGCCYLFTHAVCKTISEGYKDKNGNRVEYDLTNQKDKLKFLQNLICNMSEVFYGKEITKIEIMPIIKEYIDALDEFANNKNIEYENRLKDAEEKFFLKFCDESFMGINQIGEIFDDIVGLQNEKKFSERIKNSNIVNYQTYLFINKHNSISELAHIYKTMYKKYKSQYKNDKVNFLRLKDEYEKPKNEYEKSKNEYEKSKNEYEKSKNDLFTYIVCKTISEVIKDEKGDRVGEYNLTNQEDKLKFLQNLICNMSEVFYDKDTIDKKIRPLVENYTKALLDYKESRDYNKLKKVEEDFFLQFYNESFMGINQILEIFDDIIGFIGIEKISKRWNNFYFNINKHDFISKLAHIDETMYEKYKSQYKNDKVNFLELKNEYEKSKNEYEKSKSEYEKSKSEYEKSKSEYEKSKSEYEKSKGDFINFMNNYNYKKKQFEEDRNFFKNKEMFENKIVQISEMEKIKQFIIALERCLVEYDERNDKINELIKYKNLLMEIYSKLEDDIEKNNICVLSNEELMNIKNIEKIVLSETNMLDKIEKVLIEINKGYDEHDDEKEIELYIQLLKQMDKKSLNDDELKNLNEIRKFIKNKQIEQVEKAENMLLEIYSNTTDIITRENIETHFNALTEMNKILKASFSYYKSLDYDKLQDLNKIKEYIKSEQRKQIEEKEIEEIILEEVNFDKKSFEKLKPEKQKQIIDMMKKKLQDMINDDFYKEDKLMIQNFKRKLGFLNKIDLSSLTIEDTDELCRIRNFFNIQQKEQIEKIKEILKKMKDEYDENFYKETIEPKLKSLEEMSKTLDNDLKSLDDEQLNKLTEIKRFVKNIQQKKQVEKIKETLKKMKDEYDENFYKETIEPKLKSLEEMSKTLDNDLKSLDDEQLKKLNEINKFIKHEQTKQVEKIKETLEEIDDGNDNIKKCLESLGKMSKTLKDNNLLNEIQLKNLGKIREFIKNEQKEQKEQIEKIEKVLENVKDEFDNEKFVNKKINELKEMHTTLEKSDTKLLDKKQLNCLNSLQKLANSKQKKQINKVIKILEEMNVEYNNINKHIKKLKEMHTTLEKSDTKLLNEKQLNYLNRIREFISNLEKSEERKQEQENKEPEQECKKHDKTEVQQTENQQKETSKNSKIMNNLKMDVTKEEKQENSIGMNGLKCIGTATGKVKQEVDTKISGLECVSGVDKVKKGTTMTSNTNMGDKKVINNKKQVGN